MKKIMGILKSIQKAFTRENFDDLSVSRKTRVLQVSEFNSKGKGGA